MYSSKFCWSGVPNVTDPLADPAGRTGSSLAILRATGSIGPIAALLAYLTCVNGLTMAVVGLVKAKFPFKLSAVGTIALVALLTLRIIVFCHPKKMKLVFL